ncbi:MAG: NAD-dependent epimerase/dehydratase family protein [Polyangia bacterium]
MATASEIPPYVLLGCGYVGTRLAQSLLADGARVRGCARRAGPLEPLRALGAEVSYLDASRPQMFQSALHGVPEPVVVYSIPGVPTLPAGEAVRRAAVAAQRARARAFIYLGSSSVYGRTDPGSTEDWVDEDAAVATSDPEAQMRLSDEMSLQAVGQAGLRTAVLRLGAIYGPALSPTQPARGVRQRLRAGQYKLWDGGRYHFSRIYIDDLVRIIRACAARAPQSALYVVGDDHPCRQAEYGRWLAQHLGLPEPPEADAFGASGPRHALRGRRLRNTRMKQELQLALQYPTYKEGELQIDAVEKGTPLPTLRLDGHAPPPASPSPTPSATPEPAETALAPSPAAPPEAAPPVAASPIAVTPTWPRPLGPEDVATALGLAASGVRLIRLAPGQSAATGPGYLVLWGRPVAILDGKKVVLTRLELVPPGTPVQAPDRDSSGRDDSGRAEAVELLAIEPPAPVGAA